MNRIYLTPNFKLDEFIDPETFSRFGERSVWFIDPKIVQVAQYLRTVTGQPVTINTWVHGGRFQHSGFRPKTTNIGASLSQHRFGRAVDLKFARLSPEEAFGLVQQHWFNLRALGLTTVEHPRHTPSWLHLDCRPTGSDELLVVSP